MNSLKKFEFEKQDITVEIIDGILWFKAQDLTSILNYARTENLLYHLDEDEKLLLKSSVSGQKRDTWFVNEGGLFTVIASSTKSDTKPFKKWINHKVLPSIRKAGSYSTEKEKIFNEKLYEMTDELSSLKAEKENLQKSVNELRKQIEDKTYEMINYIKKDQNQILLEFPIN